MPYNYTDDEWESFTKTQKKILIIVHKYKVQSEQEVRKLIDWPLEPMDPETFRGHMYRLKKRISEIRESRAELNIQKTKESAE